MNKWLIHYIVKANKYRPDHLDIRLLRKIINQFMPFAFYRFIASIPRLPIDKKNPEDVFFTLSFDCDLWEDYDAMPILLRALKKRSIQASFACIGRWIEKLPDIHKQMIEDGHEIVNHTLTHPENKYFNPDREFIELSYLEKQEEIVLFDETTWKTLGYKAVGFRTPHFGSNHSTDVYSILRNADYSYSSSQIAIESDKLGEPHRINTVWEFPLSIDPGNPFTCFDTWSCFKGPFGSHTDETEKSFFNHLKIALQTGLDKRLYTNVYFDPSDIMLYPGFIDFLDIIVQTQVKITPYCDLLSVLGENNDKQSNDNSFRISG